MRDEFYIPGFSRLPVRERPHFHLCGLRGTECRELVGDVAPRRISFLSKHWHVMVDLPRGPYSMGVELNTGESWDIPRQWLPHWIVERDKRYVWPRYRHWEQRGYIEGVERGKSIRDRELRREETP